MLEIYNIIFGLSSLFFGDVPQGTTLEIQVDVIASLRGSPLYKLILPILFVSLPRQLALTPTSIPSILGDFLASSQRHRIEIIVWDHKDRNEEQIPCFSFFKGDINKNLR